MRVRREISEINIYSVSNVEYGANTMLHHSHHPNRKVVSHMHNAEGATSDDISSSSARIADSTVHPDSVGPSKAWGICTSVDLHDCIPERIRDAKQIEAYVVQLCELIEMKRYGTCQIVNFGEGRVAGYSMVQLIETSLISGHFANDTNSAYLDIFSCKGYEPTVVEEFSRPSSVPVVRATGLCCGTSRVCPPRRTYARRAPSHDSLTTQNSAGLLCHASW